MNDHTTILSFPNTGELIHQSNIPDWNPMMISQTETSLWSNPIVKPLCFTMNDSNF